MCRIYWYILYVYSWIDSMGAWRGVGGGGGEGGGGGGWDGNVFWRWQKSKRLRIFHKSAHVSYSATWKAEQKALEYSSDATSFSNPSQKTLINVKSQCRLRRVRPIDGEIIIRIFNFKWISEWLNTRPFAGGKNDYHFLVASVAGRWRAGRRNSFTGHNVAN